MEGQDPLAGKADGKFQRIQKGILVPKCINCHGGSSTSSGVDLTTFENLMRDSIVVPYTPDKSRFFNSIKSGWMPKGDSRLSDDEIDLVYQWILVGAPEIGEGTVLTPTPTPQPSVEPTPTPTVPIVPEPKYSWLLSNVFSKKIAGEQSCIECHSGSKPKANVDLSSYQKLMDSEGIMSKPIVAESPEESGVYDQLVRQKMPPFPTKLSSEEVKAVYNWIKNGALNN